MESRGQYFKTREANQKLYGAEGIDRAAIAALPIISAGDIAGAVVFLESSQNAEASELQKSLINVATQFLAKQIEG